jgi:hypothetical protein
MENMKLREGVDLEQYIKISADSISELRKVDVYRVISSIRSDNLDGVSRNDLATFIATKRSDLVAEVTEVMREDFPQDGWAADCVAGRNVPVKPMTYGHGNAIMILSGDRMGLSPALVVEARKHLEGGDIHPMTAAAVEKEAVALNDRVRGDARLLEQANTHAEDLKVLYGFAKRKLPERKALTLIPSGRFITDQDGRKVAELFQPGDSPAEREAIKRRIVSSFNALPDLVGVLLRADKEGALWQALCNAGITDKYDGALSDAVKALGDVGIADVAHRYQLDLEAIRAKLVVEKQVHSSTS